MPRAATPHSRSRRSARQARSAPSKRPPTRTASGTPEKEKDMVKDIEKEKEDVKGEPHETAFTKPPTIIPSPTRPKAPTVLLNRRRPWKHPDELEYIKPHDWDEDKIINFLCRNGFSVPPRLSHAQSPWCEVTDRDGNITIVPRGYRLPLMFAAKFQWESLRLVMTSATRNEEWDDYKFDILHVSRLCSGFLEKARAVMGGAGMDRSWRCPMFDRALTRYYRRWLVNREEFVRDFWLEYKEEEYERDILKGADWVRFVQKGHKGFSLTRDEINNGITFEQFTDGLGFSGGRLNWETNKMVESQNLPHVAEPTAEKAEEPELPPPSLDSNDTPRDPTPGKTPYVRLSPTAITIKLEEIVNDPDFFRVGLSTDHEVIHVPSTPDYEQPPSTVNQNHTNDVMTHEKPMDVEPTCTQATNPDDLYVAIISDKAVEPIPPADEFIPPAFSDDFLGDDTTHRQESVVDSVGSADVTNSEMNPEISGIGVSESASPINLSQDIEMGSVDEIPPPEEEGKDKGQIVDEKLTGDDDGVQPPKPINQDPTPLVQHSSPPPKLPDRTPAPSNDVDMDVHPEHTAGTEPPQNKPGSPPETIPHISLLSRSQPHSRRSRTPLQHTNNPNDQSSEKEPDAWSARVRAALQRVHNSTKTVKPPIDDRKVEGVGESDNNHPPMEVEPVTNSDALPHVGPPHRETTPIIQSPVPSGLDTVAPASSFTVVDPEDSMDAQSEVIAGNPRPDSPKPAVEEIHKEDQVVEESAELVKHGQEPVPPDLVEETMDPEPTSISQAPRARISRTESFEYTFAGPDTTSSSVSMFRGSPFLDEDMQSDHASGPVVRQVVSMFRETLSGVLESLERGSVIRPSVQPGGFMSVASTSASAAPIPDSSIVGELLDEIRSLKEQMREDANRRLDRDQEVQRLQTQVNDLQRQVRMMDSQSRTSVDVEDDARVPESPSTYSTFSSQVRRRPTDPGPGLAVASHPLAHLLGMDLDDPLPIESRAESTPANGSPWSTPDISTPIPCYNPTSPHDAPPLPIKTQRKHRMMFFRPDSHRG